MAPTNHAYPFISSEQIIQAVNAALHSDERKPDVNVADILAGAEAEKTCVFLEFLGLCAMRKQFPETVEEHKLPVPEGDSDQFIKKFKVLTSINGTEWQDGDTLDGCEDGVTVVKRELASASRLRFLRLAPLEWQNKAALRFEVLGSPLGI